MTMRKHLILLASLMCLSATTSKAQPWPYVMPRDPGVLMPVPSYPQPQIDYEYEFNRWRRPMNQPTPQGPPMCVYQTQRGPVRAPCQ